VMTGDLRFLYPDWPAPENVRAVNTTRRGGVSAAAYHSFNLAGHVGDDPTGVAENRARLRAALHLPADPLWMRQVHGTDVVDAAVVSGGIEADGAYTNRKNIVCAVLTADCLPIFICNRQGTEVGLLHAGWRGLAGGIIEAGLRAFRSSADDLLVWFGPAIGAHAYEVGDDVRNAFVTSEPQTANAFAAGNPGKWYLDLYGLARMRLAAHGVRATYGGRSCTAKQPDLFFSHRRDGVTGRMASLIWLA
jgi:YfiH family protein